MQLQCLFVDRRLTGVHDGTNLDEVMKLFEEELPLAFNTCFPSCEDWMPVAIGYLFTRLAAQLTARFVGGLPLARNHVWLQTSIDFTTHAFAAARKLKTYYKPLRPFL